MALTAPVQVSWTTRTMYTANGTSILWDRSHAQFVTTCEDSTAGDVVVADVTELAFAGEEIEDLATFDDEVFVLTRKATGAEWTRPWKRRAGPRYVSDLYESPHPLHTYIVRAFTVNGMMQIGPPLHIEQEGVDGLIRAGPYRIIAKIIGPQCMASLWLSPTSGCAYWVPIYNELTWDPDVIARQIGFQNAQEELDYLALPDEYKSDPQKDEREDYIDEDTLDYAFLGDYLVIRLREAAHPSGDLQVWLEAFKITSHQTGSACPPVFNLSFDWKSYAGELSDSYLRSEYTFNRDRCLSVCLHNTGASALYLLDANKLRDHAMSVCSEPAKLRVKDFCYHVFDAGTPFLLQLGKYQTPTTSNGTLFFPGYDLDPFSADPAAPLFRFVQFGTQPAHVVDIPLRSLLALDENMSDFREQDSHFDPAPFVVSWDGCKTLCVVFCRMTCYGRPSCGNRVWYIALGSDILAQIVDVSFQRSLECTSNPKSRYNQPMPKVLAYSWQTFSRWAIENLACTIDELLK
ncbi:hypothetical protein C8R47DRAFT_1312983 [Mycena vitilis]|nr:hypothetical protein C8R47DRAFT_1312983 [Mycena vitilis]